ncbi:MAG TPA: inositol monophosphatase family protein, partial [Rhodospirillales bacterium]|nr:inositol monophosphatase family protein [Rhodospirillales bacterium]
HFAMSIALEENGEITAGVIYEPINEQMFWAEKGQGAFLNDRRMRVSGRSLMNQSIFATGIPFLGRDGHEPFLKEIEAVMAVSAGIRRFGSAALDLAYVAAGRFDGFWETGLQPWDIAAGIVIVREAGGMVTELDGRDRMLESGSILAVNPNLYQELGQILKKAGK